MRIFAWVGGVLAVLIVAAVVVILLTDWNRYRDDVAHLVGESLGREVMIGGLDVDLGWTTHIRIRKATVSNPAWAADNRFAEIDALEVAIRLWPLVRGDTNLRHLKLAGATVNLESDSKGRATWQFNAIGEASARAMTPDEAHEFPVIGALQITDSAVKFVDRDADISLMAKIAQAGGAAGAADGLKFEAAGNIGNDPVKIVFSGGPIATLREGEEPYPLDVKAVLGATTIAAGGHVAAPFGKREIDLRVSAKGPDLAAILPSLKLPLPHTPSYEMTAQVVKANDTWIATGLGGNIGETDIAGRLSVDLSGGKPLIKGDLVSEKMYFDDLAPVFGLGAAATGSAKPVPTGAGKPARAGEAQPQTAGLFPDIPLDEARLETANASLRYRAGAIISESLPLESIAARIVLKDRRLVVDDIETAIAGGKLSGRVELDARKATPVTDLKISFKDLGLKPFFAKSRFVDEMGGKFSGLVDLRGTGNTIADTLAVAEGKIRIGMNGGSVSALLVEAAGLDLIEALALLVDDARVPIRCGRVDADAAAGKVTISRVNMDTPDSTLLAAGGVNLKTETMSIQIEARAKDFSLIDLAAPVTFSGRLSDPEIGIGGIDPLPFLEMGDQKNVDCAKLLQTAPFGAAE